MRRIIAVVAGLFLPVALLAQPIWLDQSEPRSIALEVLKPKKENTEFLSSTLFLSVRLGISNNLVFVGELPFSHAGLDNVNSSDTQVGNPYFGLELVRGDSPLFFEFGGRLPLVGSSNLATILGQLTDADRMEAFSPDVTSLLAALNFQNIFPPNQIFLRARVGASLWVSTGEGGAAAVFDNIGENSELFFLLSGQAGYDGRCLFLGAGLTGRIVLTNDGNFGRRSFLQLGANARLKLGRFRPGLHFRLPLEDDLKEVLDFVGGASLSYNFQ
jgi:hypothetical protein